MMGAHKPKDSGKIEKPTNPKGIREVSRFDLFGPGEEAIVQVTTKSE